MAECLKVQNYQRYPSSNRLANKTIPDGFESRSLPTSSEGAVEKAERLQLQSSYELLIIRLGNISFRARRYGKRASGPGKRGTGFRTLHSVDSSIQMRL